MSWLRKAYRHVDPRPGSLAIGGLVEKPFFGLEFGDLAALGPEHQVRNVGTYAAVARVAGHPLQGVRLKGLFEAAGVEPEAIFANVRNHSGFEASYFRREIEPIAILVYARNGAPLEVADGGPFRLVLPGIHDEGGDVHDLATLEVSDRAGPDSRRTGGPPAKSSQAGDIPGLRRKVQDPSDPRTIVSPPPN